MRRRSFAVAATIGLALLTQATAANAAEIKVIASIGVKAVLEELAPQFERAGAHKVKRALVSAKSIAYSKEGQSGTAMARLIERLGLAEELKARTVLETRSGKAAANLVEGKAELAFTLLSEILPVAGVEVAGMLPAELQSYVVFTAGVGADTKDAQAAKAFIDFLKAPAALPVLKAKGMEPGTL